MIIAYALLLSDGTLTEHVSEARAAAALAASGIEGTILPIIETSVREDIWDDEDEKYRETVEVHEADEAFED